MSNPVVLITGALTGIGRATALAFAKAGARLVVSGRREDVGQALAAELRALGAEAEYLAADIRVAVNNAGTEGKPGPLTEQTAESYAATFDTMCLAPCSA